MTRPPYVSLILGALLLAACGKEEASETPAPTTVNQQAATPAADRAAQPMPEPTPAPSTVGQPAPAPAAGQPQPENAGPVAYYNPQPVYPQEMIARAVEGEVRVKFRVNTDGTVDNIEIVSATDPAFADALKTVLPTWRFYPARKDGVPVPRTVSLTAPFRVTSRTEVLDDNDDHPILTVIDRPVHPKGDATGRVLAKIELDATARITKIDIVEREGEIGDPQDIIQALSHWVFLPKREGNKYVPAEALVEFRFTEGGNTLVQYPYPPRKSEAEVEPSAEGN